MGQLSSAAYLVDSCVYRLQIHGERESRERLAVKFHFCEIPQRDGGRGGIGGRAELREWPVDGIISVVNQ